MPEISPYVPLPRRLHSNLAIDFRITRLPCAQTIHITIEHAEGGGNQHGVVNFFVGRAVLACPLNIFGGDLLSTLLDFARYSQQRFHLVGNGVAGPITKSLRKEFYSIVNGVVEDRFGWLTPVPVGTKQPVSV